jgi:hypothetical protein
MTEENVEHVVIPESAAAAVDARLTRAALAVAPHMKQAAERSLRSMDVMAEGFARAARLADEMREADARRIRREAAALSAAIETPKVVAAVVAQLDEMTDTLASLVEGQREEARRNKRRHLFIAVAAVLTVLLAAGAVAEGLVWH